MVIGRQQGIDFALIELRGVLQLLLGHLLVVENADAGRMQGRAQRLVPAAVLALDEGAQLGGVAIEGLLRRHAIGPDLVVAVLNALHHAGDADFYELVEIGGGDGEEFDPLEQRIAGVFSLLQHPSVEAQPGLIAAEKELFSFCLSCRHTGGGTGRFQEDVPLIQDTRLPEDESSAKTAFTRVLSGETHSAQLFRQEKLPSLLSAWHTTCESGRNRCTCRG